NLLRHFFVFILQFGGFKLRALHHAFNKAFHIRSYAVFHACPFLKSLSESCRLGGFYEDKSSYFSVLRVYKVGY
ncbi:hypothetical protein, partial [Vibrio splendidus]|uniref:hypothetical protein n=1 Tax=Vibrio splendidus TaxID=29497 RepID=UPI001A7E11CC